MIRISDSLYESTRSYAAGDFAATLHHCREGVALARASHSNSQLFVALQWTAGYEQALGAFAEAKAHYQEAADLDVIQDEEQNRWAVLKQLGDLEIRMGDLPSAGLHLDRALTLATNQDKGSAICQTKMSLGWLAFKQGDLAVASQRYDEALAAAPQPTIDNILQDIKARQALLLAEESLANSASAPLMNDAITQLSAALDYWKTKHHARWIAYTEKQLGAVEALAGHCEVSDALLTESRDGFKKVGDTVNAAEAALLLSKSHKPAEFRTIWRSAL